MTISDSKAYIPTNPTEISRLQGREAERRKADVTWND